MNNCPQVAVAEAESVPEPPGARWAAGRESLAERFERALAQCKVEAECLREVLWEELPERERTAALLEAMGFQSKAQRFRDCGVTGIPVDCMKCRQRYYSRYRCTLRHCERCGSWHFWRLMEKYREAISCLISDQPSQKGRTLAMLTFTVRSRDQMPDENEPRRLMKLIRRWFKRMRVDCARWGAIFAVETGHELAVKHPGRTAGGWNLHVHALYYGPFLAWESGRELWRDLTGGEGQGFYIRQCAGWREDPGRAVRRALVHHFGYIMKPAAVSPERIAALEVLFSGVRRVHGLGCFYRLPAGQGTAPSPRCPNCGHGLPLSVRAWHRSERLPVAALEAQGRRDWRVVDVENRRVQVFGGRGP
jgi:hypothetical protein